MGPQLEALMVPFRSAIITLASGAPDDWPKLAPFVFALGLQCYRNNYAWSVDEEARNKVVKLLEELKDYKEGLVDTHVKDGVPDDDVIMRLALVSMFQSAYSDEELQPQLERLSKEIQPSKLDPWLAKLIHKTITVPIKEKQIRTSLVPVTPIDNENKIAQFHEEYCVLWDTPGVLAGRLTKIRVQDELGAIISDYTPPSVDNNNDTPTKILVAGCGSGLEVCQLYNVFENAEITAFDICPGNIAYAIRQHEELGIPNSRAKFYVADIMELKEPTQLGLENNGPLFDIIYVKNVLPYLENPIQGLKNLTQFLRPGGFVRFSVYHPRYISLLAACRRILKSEYAKVPLFGDTPVLPQVIRAPRKKDLRDTRAILLGFDPEQLSDDLKPVYEEVRFTNVFYSMNEYANWLFHPQVRSFSFTEIGQLLQETGLKFRAWELLEQSNEELLKYKVATEDEKLEDLQAMDEYQKRHPSGFIKNSSNTIAFTAQKPY